ncbi:hypothetical protein ZWY2020_031814 [Hordeum vulgare]|nr:hypothetical protein ZWY2020_031814 [Hordeum vulgare]
MSTQESEASYQISLGDDAEDLEEDDEWEEEEEEEEYESAGSEPIRKRQKASDIWEGFMILKRTSSGETARRSTCGKTSMTSLLRSAPSVDEPQVGHGDGITLSAVEECIDDEEDEEDGPDESDEEESAEESDDDDDAYC